MTTIYRSFASPRHPMAPLIKRLTSAADERARKETGDLSAKADRAQHNYAFMDGANVRSATAPNYGWVTVRDHAEFRRSMAEALAGKFVVSISERPTTDERRAFADFDVLTKEAKPIDWFLDVAAVWITGLRTCIPRGEPSMFKTCVLLRRSVVKVQKDGSRMFKNGMHLIAPDVLLTTAQLQAVRDCVIMLLTESNLRAKDDPAWDIMLDDKVDTLRMLGSTKVPTCNVCKSKAAERRACKQCQGRGRIPDREAVYTLRNILDVNGKPIVADETDMLRGDDSIDIWWKQLNMTCIHGAPGQQACTDFEIPPEVLEQAKARKASDAAKQKKKGRSKSEDVGNDSPLWGIVQSYCRQLHPAYKSLTLRRLEAISVGKKGVVRYLATPKHASVLPCMNLVQCGSHNSETIYFVVEKDTGQVVQRCHCKCPYDALASLSTQGGAGLRVRGPCSEARNTGKIPVFLRVSHRLNMFRYRKPEVINQLWHQLHEELHNSCDSEWVTEASMFLTLLHLHLRGNVPLSFTPTSSEYAHAVGAFLNSTTRCKPMSMEERSRNMAVAAKELKVLTQQVMNQITGSGHTPSAAAEAAEVPHAPVVPAIARTVVDRIKELRSILNGSHDPGITNDFVGVGPRSSMGWLHMCPRSGSRMWCPPQARSGQLMVDSMTTIEDLKHAHKHSLRHTRRAMKKSVALALPEVDWWCV